MKWNERRIKENEAERKETIGRKEMKQDKWKRSRIKENEVEQKENDRFIVVCWNRTNWNNVPNH